MLISHPDQRIITILCSIVSLLYRQLTSFSIFLLFSNTNKTDSRFSYIYPFISRHLSFIHCRILPRPVSSTDSILMHSAMCIERYTCPKCDAHYDRFHKACPATHLAKTPSPEDTHHNTQQEWCVIVSSVCDKCQQRRPRKRATDNWTTDETREWKRRLGRYQKKGSRKTEEEIFMVSKAFWTAEETNPYWL